MSRLIGGTLLAMMGITPFGPFGDGCDPGPTPTQPPETPTTIPSTDTEPPTPTLPPATPTATATMTPATPTAIPATPTAIPATPTAIPATPTAIPATPTAIPATPTAIPATPTAIPATPTAIPATPTAIPATPTAIPPTPTAAPTPTATATPATPTAIPATPTAIPPTPTAAPTPTATATPATPTVIPATPTAIPATPTAIPATPTAAPTPTATATPATPTVAPTDTPSTPTPEPEVFTYGFDDGESLVYVQVFHEPGSAGHDHVIRAVNYDGFIEYSEEDPSICTVEISFAVEEMGVDEDFMRELVGYGDTLSSTTRASIRDTMLSDSQLWSDRYETIAYSATACEVIAGGMRIWGDLTIRGVTQNMPIDMDMQRVGDSLQADGTLTFTQTQFGFQPYKLFAFENADEITMTLDVVGEPVDF